MEKLEYFLLSVIKMTLSLFLGFSQAFLHWKALQSESVDEMGIKKKGEIKGFSKNNKMYQYPNMRWFINKICQFQELNF